MQLSTRLFLFVSGLLFLICLAVYFVPLYIVDRHVRDDEKRFLEMELDQWHKTQENFTHWLEDQVHRAQGTIDAFLFLVTGKTLLSEEAIAYKAGSSQNVWLRGAKLLEYSERLDLFQVTEGSGPSATSATIDLSQAHLHLTEQVPLSDELAWVVISPTLDLTEAIVSIGIWLPATIEKPQGWEEVNASSDAPKTYLLFDPIQLWSKLDSYSDSSRKTGVKGNVAALAGMEFDTARAFLKHLEGAQKYLRESFGKPSQENLLKLKAHMDDLKAGAALRSSPTDIPYFLQQFLAASGEGHTAIASTIKEEQEGRFGANSMINTFFNKFVREVRRINILEMVTALSLISAAEGEGGSPLASDAPIGAARIISGVEVGTAIISREIFSEHSLFDAASFLSANPPLNPALPIGSAFGLAASHSAVSIVNSLQLTPEGEGVTPSFLTLGVSTSPLLLALTQVSGEPTFAVYEGKIVEKLMTTNRSDPGAMAADLEDQLSSLSDNGFIELVGQIYFYQRYMPEPAWPFAIIGIVPASELFGPLDAFKERSHALTGEISRRIIAVALGVFILSLLVLELLSRHFTRPITLLARAAEQVAEGRFDEILLPPLSATSHSEISVLSRAFSQMVKGLADREKLRSVLNKVVSKEIADEILIGHVHLGGEVRESTVLFADIRGFSQLTENLPPDEVIIFINSYMTVMTEIIENHQGVIDKYVGDAVMALFGAPVPHKYSPLQAVLAALAICDALTKWNEERQGQGLIVAEVGIGIQTGPMVAGNMGAEMRLNYTVMGANVNLAARLCAEAQGMEVLITDDVLRYPQIADNIIVKDRAEMQFKGFSHAHHVYQVLGLKESAHLNELVAHIKHFSAEMAHNPDKRTPPSEMGDPDLEAGPSL